MTDSKTRTPSISPFAEKSSQEDMSARISEDVDEYLSRGGVIQTVDHTANKASKEVWTINKKGGLTSDYLSRSNRAGIKRLGK